MKIRILVCAVMLCLCAQVNASNEKFLRESVWQLRRLSTKAKSFLCGKKQGLLNLSQRINNLTLNLMESRGEGVILDGTFTTGAGAKAQLSLEGIVLDRKLALYCALGVGASVGAEAGVSLTGLGIQTIGCSNPRDYEGTFFTAYISGAIAPVEVGLAVNFGIFPEVYFEEDFLRQIGNYNFNNISDRSFALAKTLNLVKDAITKQLKLSGSKTNEAADYLERNGVMNIVEDYVVSETSKWNVQNQYLNRLILNQLIKAVGHCHSVSVEIGVAVKEGISGGALLSHYSLIDDSLSFDRRAQNNIKGLEKLLDFACEPQISTARSMVTHVLTSAGNELTHFISFLMNLAKAPYTCTIGRLTR